MKNTSQPDFAGDSTQLKGRASKRIKEVEEKGVSFLDSYTRGRGIELLPGTVSQAEDLVSPGVIAGIEDIVRLQERAMAKQLDSLRSYTVQVSTGIRITQETRSIDSCAISTSGTWGEESISELTGMLTAARICGVKKRTVVLEPDSQGGLSPLSIKAASIAGATTIYRMPQLEGLTGLVNGWFGEKPSAIFCARPGRLLEAGRQILSGRLKKTYCHLLVLIDSMSSASKAVDILIDSVTIKPDSNIVILSTSKRILARIENLIAEKKVTKPVWSTDIDKIQTVFVLDSGKAMDVLKEMEIENLMLMTAGSETYNPENLIAGRIITGDIYPVMLTDRIIMPGYKRPDTETWNGVFSFCGTVNIINITNKAGRRFQMMNNQIDKSQ